VVSIRILVISRNNAVQIFPIHLDGVRRRFLEWVGTDERTLVRNATAGLP